jgi:ParB-like chromosome segregation protein Spo0J
MMALDIELAHNTELVSEVKLEQLGEQLSSLRLADASFERVLQRSLASHGQLSAVTAYRREDGQLELIDGFKRLRAARTLRWTTLRTQCLVLSSTEAKLCLQRCNRSQGLSELEEAWLVKTLYREERLTLPRISQLLGRHKSWAYRRLMLAEALSPELEADVRLGLLSVTAVREILRLPRGNQSAAAKIVIARGLTTRGIKRLVDTALDVDDEKERQTILEQAAKARDGPRCHKTKPSKLSPAERLVAESNTMLRHAARLQVHLATRSLQSLGDDAAKLAMQRLSELQRALLALCQTVQQALCHRGCIDTLKESDHECSSSPNARTCPTCDHATPSRHEPTSDRAGAQDESKHGEKDPLSTSG